MKNLVIRCSAIGQIMTGTSKGWSVEKTKTCTDYITKLFLENKYNRREQFETKYIEKGIKQEEDALTLLARVKKYFFKKNSERLYNEFITGEPDAYIGKSINSCKEGFDVKCSWSLWTFPFGEEKLNSDYRYQNLGYMDLTGAEKWTTVYCLVNAPANLILNEKQKLWYKMDCPDHTNEKYVEKVVEIEKNMIFDMVQFKRDNPGFDIECKDWCYDIPAKERVIEFVIERDEKEIEKIHDRVEECREWYNKLVAKHSPVMLAEYIPNDKVTVIQ